MHCPSCGFENPEGLKFCNECGAPLRMPCAQCGFTNQPQAKFCGECGAALPPQARASTASPLSYTPDHLAEKILHSKTALEGKRKQVTVLFSDLKRSMELLADRDPEEARQLLIRVGLNSGAVVVRVIDSSLHMDYTAVGQTTHLAARMEQMAMPRSILITPAVLGLAEGYVQVKLLGPVAVKGVSVPLEVYEVTGEGAVRTRLQAASMRGLTRFVGRDRELDQLRQALERAGSGHGQVVAVIGEPGVGKSRLFWEFTQSHRTQGWLRLESRSLSYGKATPYLPVIDLLKAYCDVDTHHDTRRVHEKVTGKLLTLDRTLEPTLPTILALLDVPVEDADLTRLKQGLIERIEGNPFFLEEAHLLAGHQEEAHALAEGALAHARAHGEWGHQAYALRLLGAIATQCNPPEVDLAEAYYPQALALAEELGMHPLVPHCHLGLGMLYAKIGRRAEARAELSAAVELYRVMDMTFWLPQAEATLAQVEGQ